MSDTRKLLTIGSSISQRDSECGTLGAFVVDDNETVHLLSCNHVLTDNGRLIKKRDKNSRNVFWPGNKPKMALDNTHVAVVTGFQKLYRDAINTCDLAYAKLLANVEHIGNVIPNGSNFSGRQILQMEAPFSLNEGLEIYKLGAVSGLTKGLIVRSNFKHLNVEGYRYQKIVKVQWINNHSPFSIPGDSGSVAFIEFNENLYFIGIVFAGVDYRDKKSIRMLNDAGLMPFSYICTIGDALNSYKLRFLN